MRNTRAKLLFECHWFFIFNTSNFLFLLAMRLVELSAELYSAQAQTQKSQWFAIEMRFHKSREYNIPC